MSKMVPVLLATITLAAGCQNISASPADLGATAPADANDGRISEAGNAERACPLLGIPTTVRYEIQSGTERQYRVHLVNTADAPLAAECHQHPLPGNVVMRYRIAGPA